MSLQLWFPFNGDLNDYSGNDMYGGGASNSWEDGGVLGKALNQGTTGYITTKYTPTKKDHTITFWIKRKTSKTTYSVVCGAFNGLGICVSDTHTKLVSWGEDYISEYVIPLNTWTHIAVVFKKGHSIRLYVNGTLVDYGNKCTMNWTSSPSAFQVGRWNTTMGEKAGNHSINDLRVYDNALSYKQIKEISKALLHHYRFDNPEFLYRKNLVSNDKPLTSISHGTYSVSTDIEPPVPGFNVYKISDDGVDGEYVRLNFKYNINKLDLWDKELTYSLYVYIPSNLKGRIDASYWSVVQNSSGVEWHYSRGYDSTYDYYSAGKCSIDSKTVYPNINSFDCWQRVSITFKVKYSDLTVVKDGNSRESNIYATGYFRLHVPDGRNNGTPYYYYATTPQLELGDKVTFPMLPGIEENNTYYDESGFRNNIPMTLKSSPYFSSDSPIGSGSAGFSRPGKKTKLIIPTKTLDYDKYTVSLWFKKETTEYYSGIFQFTNRIMRLMSFENSTMRFHPLGLNSTSPYIAFDYEINKWYHIVLQVDNLVARIFINGKQFGSDLTLSDKISTISTITDISIGIDSTLTERTFDGLISDVRVYTSILSESDILELYKVKGSLDKDGNSLSTQLIEYNGKSNIMEDVQQAIDDKVFKNGLWGFQQASCVCTITENGFRIQRDDNLIYSSTNKVMWGGLIATFTPEQIKANRKYLLTFQCRGKSSNNMEIYFAQQAGWAAKGGLNSITPTSMRVHGENFNSNDWVDCWAIFNTGDDLFKVATKTESDVVSGTAYFRCTELKIGYAYQDTGELGTDILINNVKLIDITDEIKIGIDKKSQLLCDGINEIAGGIMSLKLDNGNTIPIYTRYMEGELWCRVFYHDAQGTDVRFSGIEEATETNINYPDGSKAKYSILSNIELFADVNGVYEYMLKFPKESTTFNRWKQTSLPSESTATGYEPVSLAWTNYDFGPLRKAVSASYTAYNCCSHEKNWYYSIGTIGNWKGGLPAFSSTGIKNQEELWVKMDIGKLSDRLTTSFSKDNIVNTKEFIEI